MPLYWRYFAISHWSKLCKALNQDIKEIELFTKDEWIIRKPTHDWRIYFVWKMSNVSKHVWQSPQYDMGKLVSLTWRAAYDEMTGNRSSSALSFFHPKASLQSERSEGRSGLPNTNLKHIVTLCPYQLEWITALRHVITYLRQVIDNEPKPERKMQRMTKWYSYLPQTERWINRKVIYHKLTCPWNCQSLDCCMLGQLHYLEMILVYPNFAFDVCVTQKRSRPSFC